jgi:hypothetical protein
MSSDWRQVCTENALRAGITDKLKIFYACAVIGHGTERISQGLYQR